MAKQELMKEGVDPVSGNEKPVGALPEEVRDDVDAKLSVGEFVLPADVVRYIGLNNIMKLRDAAKAGLARMEAQGQMGNGDEQVVEGHPIDIEEMMEGMTEKEEDKTEMAFAVGGVVPTSQQTPVMQYAQQPVPTVPAGVQLAGQPVQAASAQYVRPVVNGGPAMQSSQYTPVFNPAQAGGTPTVTAAPTGAPAPAQQQQYTPPQNFLDIGAATGTGEVTEVIYVGPNGDEITIRFKGTVPQDPIPVGYVRKDTISPTIEKPEIEAPKIDAPEVDGTRPDSSSSSGDGDGDGESPTQSVRKTDTSFALAEIMAKTDPELATALKKYKDEYADLDFSRMEFGDAVGKVLSSFGILGIVKLVSDYMQIGAAKNDVMSRIADAKVGVPLDLLTDWNTSTRDSISIMETASAAMKAGASNNMALAMAIDDRFDSDVIGKVTANNSTISAWEKAVSAIYGTDVDSYQNSVLAKQDIDLYDADYKAYAEDMNIPEDVAKTLFEKNATPEQQEAIQRVEAGSVASGTTSVSGSDYQSAYEAQAVADYGWGSDEHFDAIEAEMQAAFNEPGPSKPAPTPAKTTYTPSSDSSPAPTGNSYTIDSDGRGYTTSTGQSVSFDLSKD